MARISIDKEIKAKTIEKAAEKFAKVLAAKGFEWTGEAMTESVEGGYYCDSNALLHTFKKGEVTSPKSNDWSYYWAIEELYSGCFYAWFIERA